MWQGGRIEYTRMETVGWDGMGKNGEGQKEREER